MAKQLTLTGDKDKLDLGNTTEVLYFFAYRAHRTEQPAYVNAQLLAHAIKMMSPAQRRQLIRTLERSEQTLAELKDVPAPAKVPQMVPSFPDGHLIPNPEYRG